MEKLLWQTYEERQELLTRLVNHQTITHSTGERTFPSFVKQLLMVYFSYAIYYNFLVENIHLL